MDSDVAIRADATPADEDVQQVIDGLVGFNARHGPPGRFQRLATFVRDGDGRIRGGAVGTLKWKWVFVSHLWVEEDLRGRGLGTRLMTALEQLARSHGAENIHLETLGFQAKDFYEGLGFRQFAELENYAGGHSRHFMWKPLEPLVVCRGIGSSSRAMSALSDVMKKRAPRFPLIGQGM